MVPISLKIRSPLGPHKKKIRSPFNVGAVDSTPPETSKMQKMPKMAKNNKKCKNPKNVQVRIDPYSSPLMLMIIFDGKSGPKTGENGHIRRG